MPCQKCAARITPQDTYTFKDKKVCEDCYIDLLIGTPEVDISTLPDEVRPMFQRVMLGWHRRRPNRHHYLRFPGR